MPKGNKKTGGEHKKFILPASSTVNEAEYIFASLNALELKDGESCIINSSTTEVITTPVVQLLISLKKKIEASGGKLAFEDTSKQVIQAFESLGLKSQLT